MAKFPEAIQDKIEAVREFDRAAAAASRAAEAARQAVEDARAEDEKDAARARVDGSEEPDGSRVKEAEAAFARARREARVAEQARLVAVDRLSDECTHGEGHREALTARAEALTAEALEAARSLESLLSEIAFARGALVWLDDPVSGLNRVRPVGADYFVHVRSVRKPSGDWPAAPELVAPVREALEGRDDDRGADQYGIPAGVAMAGPWGVAPMMEGEGKRRAEAAVGHDIGDQGQHMRTDSGKELVAPTLTSAAASLFAEQAAGGGEDTPSGQ